MKVPRLIGKRIVLRKFRLSDVDDLLEFEKKKRNGKKMTLSDAKKWIKKSVDENGYYFAVELDKKVIGYVELCHLNWFEGVAGEMGYHIGPKFRGKGYATEAAGVVIDYCFNKLKFRKVYADTDPDNKASQKVLEKLGFKLEGIIRERRFVKGRWIDEWDYGLLKREWRK